MADNRDIFTSEIYVNNQQANDAIADMTKQLTKLTDKYDDLAAKNEKLAEKTNKAKAAMDETRKSLEGMAKDTEEYAKTSKKLKDQEKAYNDLTKKLEISKHKTDEAKREMDAMATSIENAQKGVKLFGKAMEDLSGKSMENLKRMQSQLRAEMDKTKPNTKQWGELADKYAQVTNRIKTLESVQQQVVAKQGGFFSRMAKGLNDYYGAITLTIGAIRRGVAAFSNTYKTISNFEQANANLASILGATSDQMEKLEKAAIALGSSTRYSASQVTGLQTELAKLGFTVKEITDMSPAVLNFAGSVGTDLASAAALAGVALRSFNLQSDQTEDALGTMAVACNKSALSFEYLQNSFSTIAPVAKTYGLSLKDTIALLGTLANAGFDASSAATATRNILLNLSDTNGKLAKALGGSIHSFEDIMGAMRELRDRGVDLNTTLELTDKRSVAAFNTFLDGAESAQALRGELEDVDGELQRMAEQRADTVEGAIDGMKSAWEGLVLSFRNSTGTFASVFKFITGGINGIRELIDPEGTTEERTAKMYAEMFRNIGNEYISVEETRERVWAKYQELEQSIREGGGGVVYKKHALEGLKKAYNEVMPELTEMAKAANEKVLELNTQYMQKEQEILKQQAKLTENGLKQSNKAAYDKLQDQLEANRKAWNQAINDATRFKEKMEDVVSGDTTTTANGGGGGSPTEKELAKMKQAYSRKKQMLDAAFNYEEKQLKVQLLKKEISEEEYNVKIKEKKAQYYEDVLALAREYGQDESSILASQLDGQIKDLEEAAKKAAEAARKAAKEAEDAAKKEMEEWEKKMKELEELEKKAQDVRDSLRPKERINREFENELQSLEDLHTAKLISEQDYLDAVDKLHKEHNKALLDEDLANAAKYAQQVSRIMEAASNFVNSLKETETAKMEAEYQAQLTAAGDNAEERERIEAEYEQKKLDLQKKYADTEMAINIAKAVAAGALAAIEAYAAAGNPILGAVFAAIIAATTALEVATIVQQRNAIKNASAGGGGGGGSVKTGERKVTGYAEGGYTENHTTLTTVGERGTEWVAPHWMLQKDPVTFANLERYRKAGSHGHSGSVSRGFADGGFTPGNGGGPSASIPAAVDIEAAVETAIRRVMGDNAIRAYVVRKDIEELDNQTERFKKQTSR